MKPMPTVPTPGFTDLPPSTDIVSVAIGQWAVAAAPVQNSDAAGFVRGGCAL